jgi:predicted dienelactone hydrolase
VEDSAIRPTNTIRLGIKHAKGFYRTWRRWVFVFFLAVNTTAVPAHTCADEIASRPYGKKTFNVGLRIIEFVRSHRDGDREVLTAAIWYPSEEEPRPFTYHTEEDYESKLGLNASLATKGGPYPLVIFAHGAYGSGYNSAFFMEHLARHGYIAAALDYVDTVPPSYKRQIAFSRIKSGNTGHPLLVVAIAGRFVRDMNRDRDLLLTYLAEHRLGQTSSVIDEMIKMNRDPTAAFHQAIREDAIGIVGHSLGGLTALGKIGAHPDEQFRDDRIRAALIFSAPVYPFEKTLKNIDVPIMLMAGDDDAPALSPELPRRVLYDEARPPKFYLVLKNATHFAFANRGCGGLPLYRAVEENAQVRAICRYGMAFFEKYLRRDSSTDRRDTPVPPDPAWAYFVKEEKPGERSEWGAEPPPGKGGPGGILKELRPLRKRTDG